MTKKVVKYSRAEVIEILELAKIGATVREIADIIGRSPNFVYNRFVEFDIAKQPKDRDPDSIVSALQENNVVRAVMDARATPTQISNKYLSNSNYHTVSPKGIQYGSYKGTLEDIAIQLMEIVDKLEALSNNNVR